MSHGDPKQDTVARSTTGINKMSHEDPKQEPKSQPGQSLTMDYGNKQEPTGQPLFANQVSMTSSAPTDRGREQWPGEKQWLYQDHWPGKESWLYQDQWPDLGLENSKPTESTWASINFAQATALRSQ